MHIISEHYTDLIEKWVRLGFVELFQVNISSMSADGDSLQGVSCRAKSLKKENSDWIFSFLATSSLIDFNSYAIIYVQQQNE